MKKTIVLLILSNLIALGAISQTKSKKVDIIWGNEYKQSKKSTLSDVVGYDDTGIYALKFKAGGVYGLNSKYTLEHYDNEMNLSKSYELILEEGKKNRDLEFISILDNNLYLFSSFRNQKLKKKFLFVQTVDNNTLKPNNDLKKISEIDYKGYSKYNSGTFNLEYSNDSSRVLVYYHLPYDKGENEKFGIHVFDNKFELLWEKEITLPFEEELFTFEDFEVSNDGDVYLLGILFNEKMKTKRKGKPNYKYLILNYFDNGNQINEYPISVEGKFLSEMQIAINQSKDIICGGFYSEKGVVGINGSYFLRLDGTTKEIVSTNFKKFDIDFITQNFTARKEKKAKKRDAKGKDQELFQYDLDEIILKSDGGALLVGEQYYVNIVTTTTTSANGGTTTTTKYTYHYNDIIVINLSPEGTIDWNVKIAKKQITTNDNGFYSSYALSVVNDKLYFVFNDNPKNLYYKGDGKYYNFTRGKDALAVLVELDLDGIQDREALFSTSQANILARPKVCKQISKNQLIIFGQRKKTQRFAKVTFKD